LSRVVKRQKRLEVRVVSLAVARIGPRGLMGLIRIRFLAVILLIVLVVVLVLENFVGLGDRLLNEPGPGVIWKLGYDVASKMWTDI
jgi:hypothetical protein